MLVTIAVASFAGAAFLGSRGRGAWYALGLVGLGLTSGTMAWQSAKLEDRLAEVAARVADRPGVVVDCKNLLQELLQEKPGQVWFNADGTPSNTAELSWEICDDIDAWLDGGSGTPTDEQVIAVHVLTHEAVHLGGIRDEAQTECLAMQYDAAVAEALGADPITARALAERYATAFYPRMRGDYRHYNCAEGGPWDRTPRDGVWPGGLALPG